MSDESDLFFSPDFTERILGEARTVAARRRRKRGFVGFAAGSGMALALLFWMFVPAPGLDTTPARGVPRLVDIPVRVAGDQNDEPDALGDLFPDAGPVARFAAQYSDADDPGADLLEDESADAQ